MEHSRLAVDGGLRGWRHINRVCCSSCSCEGGFGLGEVPQGVVDPAFKQMDVHKQELVVESFHFHEQLLDQFQRSCEFLGFQVKVDQPRFDPLSQKGSFLAPCPFGLFLTHFHLQLFGARYFGDGVDDLSHDLGGFGFRDLGVERSKFVHEPSQPFGVSTRSERLDRRSDGLFFSLDHFAIATDVAVDRQGTQLRLGVRRTSFGRGFACVHPRFLFLRRAQERAKGCRRSALVDVDAMVCSRHVRAGNVPRRKRRNSRGNVDVCTTTGGRRAA
mmetsp:Transcript_7691/g.47549  ORF Transcript_7691/g.47549 Transcript_7691/m.47549 type:complete len:273 (+) Transcript_7691:1335-2153(+)